MNVIPLSATILGIIALTGGAAGYFKAARGDAIIKYQADEIALRDGTIARLEKDNAALTSENQSLKSQIARLERLAQGSPELVKVTQQIKNLVNAVTALTREQKNG